MFREESIWIKGALEDLRNFSVNNVLDVGSSTKKFRTQTQPHIYENVFSPLEEMGLSIYYMDKKNEEGIDYVVDVQNVNVKQIGQKFDLVICSSLLEHVQEPWKVCSSLTDLTQQGGSLLVTVPGSYRCHLDPIDTMFRPSMEELISMFPGMEIIKKKVVYIKDKEKYKLSVFSELFRYMIPAFNWKVNCLFMRKKI